MVDRYNYADIAAQNAQTARRAAEDAAREAQRRYDRDAAYRNEVWRSDQRSSQTSRVYYSSQVNDTCAWICSIGTIIILVMLVMKIQAIVERGTEIRETGGSLSSSLTYEYVGKRLHHSQWRDDAGIIVRMEIYASTGISLYLGDAQYGYGSFEITPRGVHITLHTLPNDNLLRMREVAHFGYIMGDNWGHIHWMKHISMPKVLWTRV